VTRVLLTAGSAVALIFFVAFVVARLLRSRVAGLSIRMQFFLALASMVGAFALGLGLLVLDRLEARTTLITEGAAGEEAEAIAALVGSEMDARGVDFAELGRKYTAARGAGETSNPAGAERGLSLLDLEGREVFAGGLRPSEPSTVFVSAPVVVRGSVVGSVRVVKRTIVIRRALEDMAPFILVVSIFLGVTAAAAADIIGRGIARPIEALTDFAGRVSEGERRAAPPPAFGREVQSLTFAIDSMRRQLEGRPFVETFAADLSHELKNPVAAIRASAEVLADGALDEPDEAARFVARIREATTRIEGLLGDLLSLARIEARGVEQATVLDLTDLCARAVERARERGGAGALGGALFEVEVGPSAAVRGDVLWLGRAVDNLLDNARIHGAPGEPVRVAVARDGDHVTLSVKNAGAIGRHLQKRLFRRFATSRADRGGTGLGLAIVRAIAEAHSGSAECAAVGPPQVEFRVRLPAA
jgi:two-component system, OmpR family, sensor histidine kinase CreC